MSAAGHIKSARKSTPSWDFLMTVLCAVLRMGGKACASIQLLSQKVWGLRKMVFSGTRAA